MSIRNMQYRKFRTILTVAGITVGITTFVALMSVGVGMEEEIVRIFNSFTGAGILVTNFSSMRPSIPEYAQNSLQQIEGVNDTIAGIIDLVEIGGNYITLVATEPEKMDSFFRTSIVEGNDLNWAINNGITNPVIIDASSASTLGYGIDDSLVGSSLLSGGFLDFWIVGTTSGFGANLSFALPNFALSDLDSMQNLMLTQNVHFFIVTVKDGYDMQTIADAIRNNYPEAVVVTSEEILAISDDILTIISAVLLAIGSISLIAGALMITNTTMMSVLERTREVGIIKSVGGKRGHVLMIFMTESILMSTIGGVLGCLFAIGAILGLSTVTLQLYGISMPHSFEAWIFLLGIGIAAGIGAIAGALPSWRAANVKPVEALRYE